MEEGREIEYEVDDEFEHLQLADEATEGGVVCLPSPALRASVKFEGTVTGSNKKSSKTALPQSI